MVSPLNQQQTASPKNQPPPSPGIEEDEKNVGRKNNHK